MYCKVAAANRHGKQPDQTSIQGTCELEPCSRLDSSCIELQHGECI